MKTTLRLPGRKPIGLKNIGPVSAGWLHAVGVKKRADLIRLGPVQAYLRVKDAGHRVTLNLLWALAGAERGLPWSRLSAEHRQQLLMELDAALATRESPKATRAPKP